MGKNVDAGLIGWKVLGNAVIHASIGEVAQQSSFLIAEFRCVSVGPVQTVFVVDTTHPDTDT
jgi:hypothetical protein